MISASLHRQNRRYSRSFPLCTLVHGTKNLENVLSLAFQAYTESGRHQSERVGGRLSRHSSLDPGSALRFTETVSHDVHEYWSALQEVIERYLLLGRPLKAQTWKLRERNIQGLALDNGYLLRLLCSSLALLTASLRRWGSSAAILVRNSSVFHRVTVSNLGETLGFLEEAVLRARPDTRQSDPAPSTFLS